MYSTVVPFQAWLDTLEEHYVSLDNFFDAPTIHLQLRFLNDTIAENERLIEQLKNTPTAESWPWEEDNRWLNNLKERLEQWLESR